MRVAHSLERAEEEEMMKKALEASEKLKTEEQRALDEEEEMIRQAIEMISIVIDFTKQHADKDVQGTVKAFIVRASSYEMLG